MNLSVGFRKNFGCPLMLLGLAFTLITVYGGTLRYHGLPGFWEHVRHKHAVYWAWPSLVVLMVLFGVTLYPWNHLANKGTAASRQR